jgi:DNA-binding transcriptional ArsR family regulator
MTYIEGTLVALADPTRRAIFEKLKHGAAPVGVLAEGLPVSRPAVSQHLKVLKEAGLVTDRAEGVRRIYAINRAGLTAMRDWIDGFWDTALEGYAGAFDDEGNGEVQK